MKKRIALVVVLIAGLAAALYVAFNRSSPGPTLPGTDNLARAGQPPAPREHQGFLAGEVLARDDGSPIEGAIVSLADAAGGAFEYVATDSRGHWRLPINTPASRVTAAAPGFLASAVEIGDADPHRLRIELARGGVSLSGTVQDIGGGPIGGATVLAHPTRGLAFAIGLGRSTEHGNFSLQLAPGEYWVAVAYPGYVTQRKRVAVRQNRSTHFRLTPGGRIEGQVIRRSDGTAVPNAHVSARADADDTSPSEVLGFMTGWAPPTRAQADGEGRFILEGLAPGNHTLHAEAAGLGTRTPTSVGLALGETRTNIVVYADDAYRILGRVAGPDGEPIAGIGVAAEAPGSTRRLAAQSSRDGTFAIEGVTPGRYAVFTLGRAGHYRPAVEMLELRDADVTDVELVIAPGHVVQGRVVPPGPATIRLVAGADQSLADLAIAIAAEGDVRATADEDGRFELHGVPTGDWIVHAALAGAGGSAEVALTEDVHGLEIAIEQKAAVCGRVIDTRGQPASDVTVAAVPTRSLIAPSEAMLRRARHALGRNGTAVGEDGVFCLEQLEAGDYFVYATDDVGLLLWGARHLENGNLRPIQLSAGETLRDFVLEVAARDQEITGIVTAPNGTPNRDAIVTARLISHLTNNDVFPSFDAFTGEYAVPVDADGRFAISGLRPGAYDIVALDHVGQLRGSVRAVKPGTDVAVELEAFGSLAGRASADVGAFCTVSVQSPAGGQEVAGTGSRCEFMVANLTRGTYTVEIVGETATGRAEVSVGKDTTTTIDVDGWVSVAGTVTDTTGQPLADAIVLAVHGDVAPAELAQSVALGALPRTNAAGRFTLDRVRRGPGIIAVFSGTRSKLLLTRPLDADAPFVDLGTLVADSFP